MRDRADRTGSSLDAAGDAGVNAGRTSRVYGIPRNYMDVLVFWMS